MPYVLMGVLHYLTISMGNDIDRIIRNILRDIQVELMDEFDRNFEREAFFSEAWQRRGNPIRPGRHTLVDTGALRRSIRSEIRKNSVVFVSDLPYSEIHNEGGEIKVTERMKRFFRARFYEAQGGFGRNSGVTKRTLPDGAFYHWTEKMSLNTVAEFWRFMALKKVGSLIRIPKRQFLGNAPEVEKTVREIIEENLTEYMNDLLGDETVRIN